MRRKVNARQRCFRRRSGQTMDLGPGDGSLVLVPQETVPAEEDDRRDGHHTEEKDVHHHHESVAHYSNTKQQKKTHKYLFNFFHNIE